MKLQNSFINTSRNFSFLESPKIMQEKIKPKKNKLDKIKNFLEINKKIDAVNNSQLKSSLNNFLKAFSEKNE